MEDDAIRLLKVKVRDLTAVPSDRIAFPVIVCSQEDVRRRRMIAYRFDGLLGPLPGTRDIGGLKAVCHINRQVLWIKVANMSERCNTDRVIVKVSLDLPCFGWRFHDQDGLHLYADLYRR